MKKILIEIFILVVMAAAGAVYFHYSKNTAPETTAPGNTESYETYTNEKFGYSINYPADWTFREFPSTQTGAGFRPQSSPDEVASECINIDERSAPANKASVPFDQYVKEAAVNEIQGFEKLNSIEKVTTAGGQTGYETTWIYKDMSGQEKVSLPITYFDNEKTGGGVVYKTVQVSLGNEDCLDVYNKMITTFSASGSQ